MAGSLFQSLECKKCGSLAFAVSVCCAPLYRSREEELQTGTSCYQSRAGVHTECTKGNVCQPHGCSLLFDSVMGGSIVTEQQCFDVVVWFIQDCREGVIE